MTNPSDRRNIVSRLADEAETGMFLLALTEAGLLDTLRGPGPFTVFAPHNLAFEEFFEDELQAMLADRPLLVERLLYHVVPARLHAADLEPDRLVTVHGAHLTVDAVDGEVDINGVPLGPVDRVASNGVIHIIESLLDPAGADDVSV